MYNDFCGNNLSKYLIKESRKEGKVLVFFKPCDTYSFNQLLKEHRIVRDNVYVVGVPCDGQDRRRDRLKAKGIKGILGIEHARATASWWTRSTAKRPVAKADALPGALPQLQEQKACGL